LILALYVHLLTILLELDDVVGVVAVPPQFEVFQPPDGLLGVVVVVFVGFGLGLTTGILKSGCALSINPGILLAFSSERLIKISCHS
jgi:hypothetical protein